MQIEIRGVERLSMRERQVVALKESGFGNAQIAAQLRVSQGTVATLFNRAKRKGYQVVIVLDGDPLSLFDPGGEDDPTQEGIDDPDDE